MGTYMMSDEEYNDYVRLREQTTVDGLTFGTSQLRDDERTLASTPLALATVHADAGARASILAIVSERADAGARLVRYQRTDLERRKRAIARDVMTNDYLNDAGACREGRVEFLAEHGIDAPTYVKVYVGTVSFDDYDPDDFDESELDSTHDGADFYNVGEGWDDETASSHELHLLVTRMLAHRDTIASWSSFEALIDDAERGRKLRSVVLAEDIGR